jgi:transcriptional regulator with XRE-family HTH domain
MNSEEKSVLTLAAAIRAIRVRLNKSQAEFAGTLGCSRNTVSRYELGNLQPSRSMLLLVLRWAEGEDRTAILDVLGVGRDQQESWEPGELEKELEGLEAYLDVGGRKEFKSDSPRRDFIRLAKQIASQEKSVPVWLIETLHQYLQHGNNPDAAEYFEYVPIYLDVQMKVLEARKASSNQAGRSSKR